MKDNDVELIHRIIEGDDSAFTTLVEKYQKQVHALAWRKIGDFHIAEDITQETFLKAYQKLTTLKNPQRFAGWLYVIATRCCQAWLRKKQVQTESLEEIDTDALEPEAYSRYVSEEETKVTVAAQRQVVKKLLTTLPESERTVITLHYFGEMTCEKMSEFLGVSANTIKSRLRRARNRLKQEEPMIREAINNFNISPTLTENIMKKISQLEPSTPPASKPLIPWMIGATGAVLIALMFGIGGQFLAHFQKPYSLDAQSERTVELVDAQVVQNLQIQSDNRNQIGNRTDLGGRSDGNEANANQAIGDDGDYTRWKLPEGAKRRIGKGVLTDMKLSPDNSRVAIASSAGIWLYDVHANQEMKGAEVALLTDHEGLVRQLTFSTDGEMFASIGVDKTIRLWKTSNGKLLFTLTTPKPTGEFRSVKFIRDGKTLAARCSDDYKVYLWDVTSGKYLESFRPKLPLIRLGQDRDWRFATGTFFDPIGNITFAIGNKDGTISIKEGRKGLEKIKLVGYTDESQFFKVDNEHDRLNPRKPTVRRSLVRPGDKPTVPKQLKGDKPTVPKQLKVDGTPFPIQYLLSDRNHSSHNYEKQPTKWINTLDFSPDGNTLVSTSKYMLTEGDGYTLFSGGPIEIWDVETGEQLASLTLSVTDVVFSGDGKTLAITGDAGVSVWDIPSRQEICVFKGHVKATFSGDGKMLCIIENNRFTFWDINTRSEFSTISPFQAQGIISYFPESFTLSQNGNLLATADVDGVINVWETKTPSKIRTLAKDYEKTFTSLTFKHDGRTLVSGNANGWLQSFDFNTGNLKEVSKPVKRNLNGLFYHKDGTTLTVVSDSTLLRPYPFETHTLLNAINWSGSSSFDDGTQIRVKVLAFSSNGKRLATKNSKNRLVDVWDITLGKNPQHISSVQYHWGSVVLSPDGAILATASQSGNGADLWHANTGALLTKLSLPKKLLARNNNIYSLAFSHDGKIMVGGTNKKEIHLWDMTGNSHIGILKRHKHAVCALVFSPDNTILASGDTGGGIYLWKFSDRSLIATYKSSGGGYISNLAFSPDGKTLASTSGSSNSPKTPGGTIFLWNVPSK